jgi:putative ABC transport system permease protein
MGEVGALGPTLLAVALLGAIAVGVLRLARVPAPWEPALALARAVVQLGLLSLVLAGVVSDLRLVALALAVMLVAAVVTAARRARIGRRGLPMLALAMAAGPTLALAIVLGSGAVAPSGRYVLAVGGIVLGASLTVAVLTNRLLRAGIEDHWDEIEGWLALGATPRAALAPYARAAVRTAVLPAIDQTRTTGIVVMPGAFIGAVFAGASPLEAGRFQLVVLAGILTSGVLCASLLAFGPRPPLLRPAPQCSRD